MTMKREKKRIYTKWNEWNMYNKYNNNNTLSLSINHMDGMFMDKIQWNETILWVYLKHPYFKNVYVCMSLSIIFVCIDVQYIALDVYTTESFILHFVCLPANTNDTTHVYFYWIYSKKSIKLCRLIACMRILHTQA